MAVIAMTREMGSRGREVAERVAEQMGLTLILHELVEHDLADRMHVPESTVHHRFEGGATLRDRWLISSWRLAHHTTEKILELAQNGNVLVRGWGACALLRDVPHAARVRVCAPMDCRERSVIERGVFKDRGAARQEIERNDAAHKRTLQAAFGVDREDPLLYNLVLNTGRLSIESCVKPIRDLAESPEFRETEASRAVLNDKLLEAHIRVKLAERFTAGTGLSRINAAVSGGGVVLKGIAIHSSLAAEASEIVGAIPGVVEVQNRIEIVRGPRSL